MDQIEAWSIQREAPAMMLEVDVENIAAVALYESLGYAKISTRKDYYGPSLDAFVMRKVLVHA
jgi:ribosomal protein S18 acetylase RimI-like enzyme